MKKRILCLVMGLVMAGGISSTALAEDYKGASGWQSEFNGSDIVSNFDRQAVADEMTGLLPGDSMELSITTKNSDSSQTDWYMTNEVVQTLEDAANSAEGGAYEYRLVYTNAAGAQTVLYDSASVGGEVTAGAKEGLYQIGDAAEQYFYLDRLGQGQTGRVTLWMKVDGETQGNGYQNTLAQLQLNFAVEEVPEAEVQTQVNHRVKTVSGGTKIVTTVQTGDTAPLILWSAVALAAGLAFLWFGMLLWKRNREKGE